LGIGPTPLALQRDGDRGAVDQRPVPSSETSTVGLAPVEERAHDAAGDRHGADGVAEGGAGGRRHVLVLGLLHAERDAGATPIGERIVGAAVGVGAAPPWPLPRT
jgi:hypothetical protein